MYGFYCKAMNGARVNVLEIEATDNLTILFIRRVFAFGTALKILSGRDTWIAWTFCRM